MSCMQSKTTMLLKPRSSSLSLYLVTAATPGRLVPPKSSADVIRHNLLRRAVADQNVHGYV